MGPSKKGAISELIACNYFIKQGYEVFRNVVASGPADLVVWSHETGETMFIDVKTTTKYVKQDGSISYNFAKPVHKEKGVRYLLVYEEEVIGFMEDFQ